MDHNKLSLARLAVNLLYQSYAHWLKAVNELWGSAPLPQSVKLRPLDDVMRSPLGRHGYLWVPRGTQNPCVLQAEKREQNCATFPALSTMAPWSPWLRKQHTHNDSALADHCHASRNSDGNNQTLVKGL